MNSLLSEYIKILIKENLLQEKSEFTPMQLKQKLNEIGKILSKFLKEEYPNITFSVFGTKEGSLTIFVKGLNIQEPNRVDYLIQKKLWSEDNLQPKLIEDITNTLNEFAKENNLTLLSTEDADYHGYDWTYTFDENSQYKASYTVDEMPEKLYHVTNKIFLEDIKKNGLQPKTRVDFISNSSRKYAGRIYVNTSQKEMETYAIETQEGAEDNVENFTPAIIIIDTSKLPRDMIFYRDEEYQKTRSKSKKEITVDGYSAFYTLQAIPTSALTFHDSLQQFTNKFYPKTTSLKELQNFFKKNKDNINNIEQLEQIEDMLLNKKIDANLIDEIIKFFKQINVLNEFTITAAIFNKNISKETLNFILKNAKHNELNFICGNEKINPNSLFNEEFIKQQLTLSH